MKLKFASVLTLSLLTIPAISARAATPLGTATAVTSAGKPIAATGTLDDAQIAKIVLTINEGEIDAGKMAKKDAKSKAVKDFAAMMVSEHEKNIKETNAWVKKAGISPADSPISEKLMADAKTSNADLKKTPKAGIDKTYVSQQVMMHEKALNSFDKDLIPSATNPDLKAHLTKTRAAVAEHLEHAKGLQGKM
ncbi:MAG: DUF4142 domain-containing protein [Proteobacteria bacterium]|nr:MAG: DUF4142 domain-containing protein [Pseudomonadota bacterium]